MDLRWESYKEGPIRHNPLTRMPPMRVPANNEVAMRDNRGNRDDWDLCKRRRVIARVG
jgi:hypothetical protein